MTANHFAQALERLGYKPDLNFYTDDTGIMIAMKPAENQQISVKDLMVADAQDVDRQVKLYLQGGHHGK